MQRGHVIIMEGQPCAGMFFIVTGQVIILARKSRSVSTTAADGEAEVAQEAGSDLQTSQWNPEATSAWWGLAGPDRQLAGGKLVWRILHGDLQCFGLTHQSLVQLCTISSKLYSNNFQDWCQRL